MEPKEAVNLICCGELSKYLDKELIDLLNTASEPQK